MLSLPRFTLLYGHQSRQRGQVWIAGRISPHGMIERYTFVHEWTIRHQKFAEGCFRPTMLASPGYSGGTIQEAVNVEGDSCVSTVVESTSARSVGTKYLQPPEPSSRSPRYLFSYGSIRYSYSRMPSVVSQPKSLNAILRSRTSVPGECSSSSRSSCTRARRSSLAMWRLIQATSAGMHR